MNWVRVGETIWNLNSIARLSCDEKVIGTSWTKWVQAVITLGSGKEFGVSKEDYIALTEAIENSESPTSD